MMQVLWGTSPLFLACAVIAFGFLFRIGWELAGWFGWMAIMAFAGAGSGQKRKGSKT